MPEQSRSTISPRSTRSGLRSAELLANHVTQLARSLPLTDDQKRSILRSLGMTAVASKGQERVDNLNRALDNALSSRIISVDDVVDLLPWQQALDWNTSLALKESAIADPDGRLLHDFSRLVDLWRSSSPFTIDENGSAVQRQLQTSPPGVLGAVADHVQEFLRDTGISEITLHKALKWENQNAFGDAGDNPLSEHRPDWFRNPGPDMRDDLFDEGPSKTPIGAASILLTRFTGFTLDRHQAVQIGRWSDDGEPSRFYAVLTGTFPVEAIVSIPSFGFGTLSRMEVVVDRNKLDAGAFSVVFGKRS